MVLDLCSHVLWQEGDTYVRRELDPSMKHTLTGLINSMASDALRTICTAYSEVHENRNDWTVPPENNLTLVAILGIRVRFYFLIRFSTPPSPPVFFFFCCGTNFPKGPASS